MWRIRTINYSFHRQKDKKNVGMVNFTPDKNQQAGDVL